MGDDASDLWKAYLKNVKALSFPKTAERKPQKIDRRVITKHPLKAFVEKLSIENVSRETFLSAQSGHVGISRKKMRNTKIERTIDLHGLTLKEAYQELSIFLWKASHHSLKMVLVITGKGYRAEVVNEERERRLTLKEVVPQWLQELPLKSLVGSWSKASSDHGGEGALYVFLRTTPLK